MIEGTEQDVSYRQFHPRWWNSRECYGRALLRPVVSLVALDILREPL